MPAIPRASVAAAAGRSGITLARRIGPLTATEDQWELWALYSLVAAEMWNFCRPLTLLQACLRFSGRGLRLPANRSPFEILEALVVSWHAFHRRSHPDRILS